MKITTELESQIAALLEAAPAGVSAPRCKPPQRIVLDGLTNAVTGQNMFLETHEYPAYMDLGAQYIAELRPVGVRETQLAQKVIDLNWRLNTLAAVENNLFHSSRLRHISPDDKSEDRIVGMTSKADAWRKDCEGPNAFEKLGRHEMRVERTQARLTAEFERLQAIRLKKGPDTFVLAECKAWVWYDRMLSLHRQLAAERRAASVKEPVNATESAASLTELLCRKPLTAEGAVFAAAAAPLLHFAAANGLLTPESDSSLDLPKAA